MKERLRKAIAYLMVICMIMLPITVYGADGNMGGDAGGMGQGGDGSFWDGDEGIRITIVDKASQTASSESIDFSNSYADYSKIRNSGGKNKLDYKNGASLVLDGNGYDKKSPDSTIPQIISSNGYSNIEQVKSYFCDESTIRNIARIMGMSYDSLISGDYTIMLEPVAYFKFKGVMYALTATECAYFNEITSGQLKSAMGNLTHRNLPLAMYLVTSELGFSAWKGGARFFSDREIKSSGGIGTINFKDGKPTFGGDPNPKPNPTPPNPNAPGVKNMTAHTDTTIYLSVKVKSGEKGVSSKLGLPASVTFNVNGTTLTSDKLNRDGMPPYSEELVFVKYKTPKKPQNLAIKVSTTGDIKPVSNQILLEVKELKEITPLDTNGEDKPQRKGWVPKQIPNTKNNNSNSWTQWKESGASTEQVKANIKSEQVADGTEWVSCWWCGGSGTDSKGTCRYCDGWGGDYETKYVWKNKISNLSENKEWKKSQIKNRLGSTKHLMVWQNGSVVKDDFGNSFQEGKWSYVTYNSNNYDVRLNATYKMYPADTIKNRNGKTMKSGYGVEVEVRPSVSGTGTSFCTNVQHINATFPEFNYRDGETILIGRGGDEKESNKKKLISTYQKPNRLLEKDGGIWKFKKNEYAKGDRIHFTPIWFPDNEPYIIHFDVLDCWTPAGELRVSSGKQSPKIIINGNLFDDWGIEGYRGRKR